MNLINYVHEQLTPKRAFPEFRPGDNISVSYKIIEGAKERIQIFCGAGIERSKLFDWRSMAKSHAKVYAELVPF